jgi:Tfx family DNA-binding protein
MEVLRLRRQGLTQAEVAKSLGTSRENVSIIERNAFRTLKAAKSTIEAFESLDADNSVTIPVRTSIYDIPRIILVRGDVLGVRIKTTSDDLISPMTVEISQDGRLIIK